MGVNPQARQFETAFGGRTAASVPEEESRRAREKGAKRRREGRWDGFFAYDSDYWKNWDFAGRELPLVGNVQPADLLK